MYPQILPEMFLAVPLNSPYKNAWNGCWNALLNHFFPIQQGWAIAPKALPPFSSRDSLDSAVSFLVSYYNPKIPAMLVEIKPFSLLGGHVARAEADEQMRYQFGAYLDVAPPTLIGLSAFGHMVCKYELKKTTCELTPEKFPRPLSYIDDTAPEKRWDLDLTTEEGCNRMMAIIEQVKNVVLAEATKGA